jgi:hypothetical protein
MDAQTKVKNELITKLKTISNDREFLLSVINSARDINDRKAVIYFIDNAENVTYENVILFALTLYEKRNK